MDKPIVGRAMVPPMVAMIVVGSVSGSVPLMFADRLRAARGNCEVGLSGSSAMATLPESRSCYTCGQCDSSENEVGGPAPANEDEDDSSAE